MSAQQPTDQRRDDADAAEAAHASAADAAASDPAPSGGGEPWNAGGEAR